MSVAKAMACPILSIKLTPFVLIGIATTVHKSRIPIKIKIAGTNQIRDVFIILKARKLPIAKFTHYGTIFK